MLLGSEGEKVFCRNTQSPRHRSDRGQQKTAACISTFGTAGRQEPPQESWPCGSKSMAAKEHSESEILGQDEATASSLAGYGGAALRPPQAAWVTGKSSGLGARNPGSWVRSVAVTLREPPRRSGWEGCPGLPRAPPSETTESREGAGRGMKKNAAKARAGQAAAAERDRPCAWPGPSAWPGCLSPGEPIACYALRSVWWRYGCWSLSHQGLSRLAREAASAPFAPQALSLSEDTAQEPKPGPWRQTGVPPPRHAPLPPPVCLLQGADVEVRLAWIPALFPPLPSALGHTEPKFPHL